MKKLILEKNWPEYLAEAFHLCTFMISAGVFGVLLESSASPFREVLTNDLLRRSVFGLAMGLTAIGIIYSPWGRQSGAHMNPAVTLTYMLLGKVRSVDAFFYILAQFIGGAFGVYLVLFIFGDSFSMPPVNFVATLPGGSGEFVAFLAETTISFFLMSVILGISNSQKLSPLTGLIAGTLVFLFITFEAPLSGMSMNPARSFASAFPGQLWNSLWIYFASPILGMLSAAVAYKRTTSGRIYCAKLDHNTNRRCIFNCEYDQLLAKRGA